jgi:hypothetical protein
MVTERGPRPPEVETNRPSIRLEFFRHDEKAKQTSGGDRTGDEFIRLTQKGREHAAEVGKTKNPHAEVAVAFGSQRERAVETSMRQMLADEDTITPEMSLEDMRAEVAENLKVGKKDQAISELNFDWDTNRDFAAVAYPHVTETKDALIFLRDESDALILRNKDKTSDSYSRSAGNFAELVDKYCKILPRWKQIVAEHPEQYQQVNNEMQRFFGTHLTVSEPFLMKVIEKTEGSAEVENFLASLKTKNGFESSEGYTVTIEDQPGQPSITVKFKDKQWSITPEILGQIIQERDELDKQIGA